MPKNGNSYYLLEDTYIKGGFRAVADKAERDAIDSTALKPGMFVVTTDTGSVFKLENNMSWSQVPLNSVFPYDLCFNVLGGLYEVNSLIGSVVLTRDMTLLTNLPLTQARCKTPPETQVVFDISASGFKMGDITFAAGSQVGAIYFANDVELVAGQVLELSTSAVIDAKIADISITLVGATRSMVAPT
jgi:hypothetical protein